MTRDKRVGEVNRAMGKLAFVAASSALAASLVLGAARPAFAEEMCVSETAKKSLGTCPNTGPQSLDAVGSGGKKASVQFHTKLGPEEANKKKDIKPPAPDQEMTAGARAA
jgi:hypothetical protein